MKLKFCPSCKDYNLTSECKTCKKETKDAHYKFIHLKDEKEIHPD
jgi:recombinational DNA repair protein RecR